MDIDGVGVTCLVAHLPAGLGSDGDKRAADGQTSRARNELSRRFSDHREGPTSALFRLGAFLG